MLARRHLTIAVTAVLTVTTIAQGQRKPAPRLLDKSFDAAVDSILAQWKVPGIGLAIVKGNQVIYLKGYGYKDLDQKVPVTPQTKFAIGSVSKSFTVTALAAQAQDKKFEWDAPLRRYLPDFQMFDPVATERMTPRDLVTHRSGLPRHDVIWAATALTRDEIYQRIRYFEPSKDFRSVWQYQNLMFMTAGILSSRLDGKPWEDVVKARVFGPLGMNTADFSVNDLQHSADYSFGYARLPTDSVVRIPYHVIDPIGPAGSINASVEEMAKYLTMHLNQGRFDGREVIPAAQAKEMQTQQMVMPSPAMSAGGTDLADQQYGMAFMIGAFRGHKMVHHGGNIDGFSAEVNFLPNDSLGVVVLTNMNGTFVRDFLPFVIYDRLLGLDPINWSSRYQTLFNRGRAMQDSARAKDVAAKVANTTPSHPLADYAGVYHHPGYGDITVATTDGKLSFKYGIVEMGLAHWHYDVFETEPRSVAQPIRWKVQFHMDPTGAISGLSLPIEPALKPTVFARQKTQ